jgi:AcrR family transcriptional regulator
MSAPGASASSAPGASASSASSASSGAGRPRDPEIEPRVREAVLRLLVERGYAGLRIDDVAGASGVAKTTIYRRWRSLALLVLDAVGEALGAREVVSSGGVQADLEALVRVVHHSLVDNPVGCALPAIGMDLLRQPELAAEYRRRFVEPLRAQAVTLIRQGVAEGRFGADVTPEVLVDAVSGAIIYRRLVGDAPPSVSDLLVLALSALRPHCDPRR